MQLPSGAELVILDTPFRVSNALYKVVLKESANMEITSKADLLGIFRVVFLNGMCSDLIQVRIWECLKHCTYNGVKITEDTFEPVSAREDYPLVCMEVAHSNVAPFLKNLSAQFSLMLDKLAKDQESK